LSSAGLTDLVDDEPARPDPEGSGSGGPSQSLRHGMLRGSIWTLIGYCASQVIRLAGNLVLSRLLFPEAFGVSALVAIFIQGLEMFSDVGITPCIVRSPRGESPEFLDTAWTIQAGRGLMLWTASALIAWPIAVFYGIPQLAALIPVAGVNAAIGGFYSTSLPLCTRRLQLGWVALVDVGGQVAALASMAYLAWRSPSVWALVIGGVVGSIVKLAIGHLILADRPNRFRWDPSAVRELFRFGRWIFVSTLITFLAGQSDRLILGRLTALGQLGLYTTALSLSQVPQTLFAKLSYTVVYPTLAHLLHRPGGATKAGEIRLRLLLAAAPVCAATLVLGRPVVRFLFDPRYAQAGTYLGLLALGTWFQVLHATYGSAIMAKGATKFLGGGVACRLAIFTAGAWPAYHWFGTSGVAALSAMSELGVVAMFTYGATKLGVASTRHDALANVVFAASILLLSALYALCDQGGVGVAIAIWGVSGAAIALGTALLSTWMGRARNPSGGNHDTRDDVA
jgi:O-antigen/teichoic acid export membrane protein